MIEFLTLQCSVLGYLTEINKIFLGLHSSQYFCRFAFFFGLTLSNQNMEDVPSFEMDKLEIDKQRSNYNPQP